MEWIISFLSTLGIFALALLILVFFHELGHFLAAKFFGMRVERFSLGFPPRIWGFKKGDTDYCIGATPLGGYVKISGMIDESMDTDHLDEEPKPWEFRSKPVWQRIIVITAGVIFNMLLAGVIYAGLAFTEGDTKVPLENVEGIYVAEGSLAEQIGFRTGDRFLSVNGEDVTYFQELVSPTQLTRSDVYYTVLREGEPTRVALPDSVLNDMGSEGFISLQNAMPSEVGSVQDGSPADTAGLRREDRITAVNGEPIGYWVELVEAIEANAGDTLTLEVDRSGEWLTFRLLPRDNNTIGIASELPSEVFGVQRFEYGLGESFQVGVERTSETFTGIVQGFAKLFSGDISVRENLGGPVAIANVTREATDLGGVVGFWNITAFLSVTLAIMNILPIPVLDGGHLMFLFYEGITRREPSARVRMILQQIGFIIIIALFIYVTFNDILRQFG